MHLQVCDNWPVAPFFDLPRVHQTGILASVGGRVVCTTVGSTIGIKVNCPVAVHRDMLGTETEN